MKKEAPWPKYKVELEIKDCNMTEDGLRCFLEHSLAQELSLEQLGKKVTVAVKKIQEL